MTVQVDGSRSQVDFAAGEMEAHALRSRDRSAA